MPADKRGTKHGKDGESGTRDGDRPSGPSAFWSGTITFGLVSVPVELYPAIRTARTSLRTFGPEGQPLVRRYFCSADGEALDRDEIVRGYEWEDGSFTVVDDDELEALEPRKSRDIDLERFVDRDRIPLEMLERSYVLAPSGESTKAYHLLATTMERNRRAGIATFVMRGKEYLAAIFASGGLLEAATLRFAAELRTPETIGLPAVPKVPAADRRAFEKLLAELADDELDTELLSDDTGARLAEIAETKLAKGLDVVEISETPPEDPEETAEIIDIMSVLRARMNAANGSDGAGRARGGRDGSRAKTGDGRRNAGEDSGKSGSERASGRSRSTEALEAESKQALYERARRRDVPGRSQMTKEELIDALSSDGAT